MTVGNFQHIGELVVTGNMVIQDCKPGEYIPKRTSRVIFSEDKVLYERSSDADNDAERIFKYDGRDAFYSDSKIALLLGKLAKLDGKADLSINDLKEAEKLKGIELGHINNNKNNRKEFVKDVDMSQLVNGEITITTTSGLSLHINAETEDEKAARENEEAARDAKYNISEDEYKAAQNRGREMQDCLHGYTTDRDWTEFTDYINETNAGNVLQTLRGFEYEACDDSAIWNSERFFQQLFTENRDTEAKAQVAQKIIGHVLEYINENKDKITDKTKRNTLNEIETSFSNANLTNNMSNSFGKLLDNKMHQLFEIFGIKYNY